MSGATKLGVAAGAVTAAMWTAPQISSVALAASDCGCSPMPPTTTTAVPPGPGGAIVDPNGRRAGGSGGSGSGSGGGAGTGGMLPVTGANSEELAKFGVATAALGGALFGASKLRRPPTPEDPATPASGDAAD